MLVSPNCVTRHYRVASSSQASWPRREFRLRATPGDGMIRIFSGACVQHEGLVNRMLGLATPNARIAPDCVTLPLRTRPPPVQHTTVEPVSTKPNDSARRSPATNVSRRTGAAQRPTRS